MLTASKVVSEFSDVPADILYDTLHDPDFRSEWDKTTIEGYEICRIDGYNVIEYFGS